MGRRIYIWRLCTKKSYSDLPFPQRAHPPSSRISNTYPPTRLFVSPPTFAIDWGGLCGRNLGFDAPWLSLTASCKIRYVCHFTVELVVMKDSSCAKVNFPCDGISRLRKQWPYYKSIGLLLDETSPANVETCVPPQQVRSSWTSIKSSKFVVDSNYDNSHLHPLWLKPS